jgi:3',5'-cyclic AMP phosphodiesterase CpdA
VIDNSDLVYSGKPNQYRIFNQMTSGISTTLCTTLGNHDIRGDGRETYQKLYGPEYYSFDFGGNHFIFLDSSRGYAEKQAIPDVQYAWLERDLQKAQGKRIYVISHVPPTDPRSGVKPNEVQSYTDKVEKEGGFVEQKLEAYSEDESINHGFQTKQEAKKFENLMTQYKVDAVYLSHIHSYFDYTKNGVRYIISGGAGAELMTQNSYYHYLIAKAGATDTLTMVQLPSPPNLILQRYAATVSLFADYKLQFCCSPFHANVEKGQPISRLPLYGNSYLL